MDEPQKAKVGYREKVDLRKYFPISRRYAFRKSLSWFCALLAVVVGYRLLQGNEHLFGSAAETLREHRVLIFSLFAIGLFLKYIYSEVYRRTFFYGTEGFRMVISRGIVLKDIGSLPLLPVSEIYVRRSLIDMLLGLYNVDVYTPMDQSRKFARIESLNRKTALALQAFLGDVLTTQIFLAPGTEQNESLHVEAERVPPMSPESFSNSIAVPDIHQKHRQVTSLPIQSRVTPESTQVEFHEPATQHVPHDQYAQNTAYVAPSAEEQESSVSFFAQPDQFDAAEALAQEVDPTHEQNPDQRAIDPRNLDHHGLDHQAVDQHAAEQPGADPYADDRTRLQRESTARLNSLTKKTSSSAASETGQAPRERIRLRRTTPPQTQGAVRTPQSGMARPAPTSLNERLGSTGDHDSSWEH